MKDPAAALHWIVNELQQRNIPFALVGGLAANAYGTSRPLWDIDIDVPERFIPLLANELSEFLTFGPEHSIGEYCDCQIVGFSYHEQEIELSGAESMRIKDPSSQEWLAWPTDLSRVEYRSVFGITVPVMAREQLIAYKRLAGRDTDLLDVQELESCKA
jgi:hypothetical protein